MLLSRDIPEIAEPDLVAAFSELIHCDMRLIKETFTSSKHSQHPMQMHRPFLNHHSYIGLLLLFLSMAFVSPIPALSQTIHPTANEDVALAMQPYLESYQLAGVVAIIADRNGKLRYKNEIGFANVEDRIPISDENVFWIASMTKMFAGASILMLVDEGKLSLDDPATKYIPQLRNWMVVEERDAEHVLLRPPVRPVTIRHLLSHTSGLSGQSELQLVTGNDTSSLKARSISSVTGPLQWHPGDKYQYGNQGMNIAARIVEVVSKITYDEFLQRRIFEPLGMNETTFWPTEARKRPNNC
ncbi:CubicO group peptidase (beta-lactamase class C family) [Rhodopirellula rubra]|uniref:CubicO group peptidase (Beta-lactamase class C family) n=1 Tax=Aporhodopirellula rubra TaxID=980271 RepID=A0A7W5H9Q2_9BACT|nr:serine hydrolase domain-containing protein [Aporhodopirellula rubra]MBB3210669.1 CubicO group peptidase (beta-lactamase class C family) [Aporhodopirellula rubra]